MFPYVLLILSIFFFSFLEKEKISFACGSKVLDSRYLCCFFCILILDLFVGLRATTVGIDLPNYIIRYVSSKFILDSPFERGYAYLNYFFQNIIQVPFQVFLFFLSSITCLSLFFLFIKFSKDITFSLVLYITIGTFTMAMSGIRQTLAMAITWLSIYFIEKRKLLLFSFLVLLASSIHNSAVIFFGVYFLWGLRLSRKQCFILMIFSLSFFYARFLLSPLVAFLQNSKYEGMSLNANYNINFLVLLVAISIPFFCYLYQEYDKDKKCNCHNSFFFLFSCLNVIFLIVSQSNNQVGRLAYYFNIGNCLLIPSVIDEQKKYNFTTTQIIKIIILLFALAYFFISTPGGTLRIDNYKMFFCD